MIRKFACLTIVLLAILPAVAFAYDFEGERLKYEFGWKGFTAAEAKVKIDSIQYNGQDCYNIEMNIKSLSKLDWIWKVRDRLISYSRKSDLLPERFMYYQREGNFKLDTQILHDSAENKLKSTRTRIKGNKKKAYKSKEAPFGPYHDPIGALMYLRTRDLEVGKTYKLKAFDGKRKHDITYTVKTKEKIKIKTGEYVAFKIIPKLVKSSGENKESNVEKVQTVTMWVAATPDHTVLRIESKIWVGSVYIELVGK